MKQLERHDIKIAHWADEFSKNALGNVLSIILSVDFFILWCISSKKTKLM